MAAWVALVGHGMWATTASRRWGILNLDFQYRAVPGEVRRVAFNSFLGCSPGWRMSQHLHGWVKVGSVSTLRQPQPFLSTRSPLLITKACCQCFDDGSVVRGKELGPIWYLGYLGEEVKQRHRYKQGHWFLMNRRSFTRLIAWHLVWLTPTRCARKLMVDCQLWFDDNSNDKTPE